PKARAVPTGRIGDRAICDRPAALVHFGHSGQMGAHDGPFRIGHGHKEIGTGREDWTKKYFMAALLGAPGRQSTSCESAANWYVLTDRKSLLSKLQAHLGMAGVIDQMGILPTIGTQRARERPARSMPTISPQSTGNFWYRGETRGGDQNRDRGQDRRVYYERVGAPSKPVARCDGTRWSTSPALPSAVRKPSAMRPSESAMN